MTDPRSLLPIAELAKPRTPGELAAWVDERAHAIVEVEAVDHTELVARHCAWIKAAAEGKASKADHYGSSHVLIIAFDDWWEPRDADVVKITAFVNESVRTLPLNFATLYLIGMSGT